MVTFRIPFRGGHIFTALLAVGSLLSVESKLKKVDHLTEKTDSQEANLRRKGSGTSGPGRGDHGKGILSEAKKVKWFDSHEMDSLSAETDVFRSLEGMELGGSHGSHRGYPGHGVYGSRRSFFQDIRGGSEEETIKHKPRVTTSKPNIAFMKLKYFKNISKPSKPKIVELEEVTSEETTEPSKTKIDGSKTSSPSKGKKEDRNERLIAATTESDPDEPISEEITTSSSSKIEGRKIKNIKPSNQKKEDGKVTDVTTAEPELDESTSEGTTANDLDEATVNSEENTTQP